MTDWKTISIKEVITELPKSQIQVQQADNIGPYPFFTSGEKTLSHSKFIVDDALIFMATGGKANVKFYNGKAAYSTDTYALKSKTEDSEYIFNLLLSKINYINRNFFSGSGLKHLQKKDFKNYSTKIPSNKNEQQIISYIFGTINKSISSTELLIAKYQSIKTGLLHNLLTFGIDVQGRIRSEETHQFKDSPLGRIPVEWICKPLKEVYSEIKSGGTPLRKNKDYFENGIHLWVKTLDLNEGEISDTQEKITDIAMNESSCSLVSPDSILIAMYGGWEQIGRTGILKKQATTNQAITALNNPKFDLKAEYTQYFLQCFRYKWKLYAISTRKDPNITKADIQKFQISFPANLAEQKAIIEVISNCNKIINQSIQESQKFISIKNGLLQDLLCGKVRLPDELLLRVGIE